MRELLLIRHAPVATRGRMMGRSDWAADLPQGPAPALGAAIALRIASPALRCRQTARWLGGDWQEDARLWEQDFGAWEGQPYEDLPDLGPLSRMALAEHCPPEGESFLALCARYRAALADLPPSGKIVVVTHAGIIRAALGHALGAPDAGLAFNMAPLSLTRLHEHEGAWSIAGVNLPLSEIAR